MFAVKRSVSNVCFAFLLLTVVQVTGCGSPEERAQSHFQRGEKLLAQNDHVKASIEFKNALQLNKNLVGAWRGLAQIEERKQNWQGLAAILRTIVELDSKDVEARLRLARLMLLANALDDCLKMVDAAKALDSRHAGVLALKAAILLKLNDNNGALREAHAALEIDPANAGALIILAAERLGRGDAQGALAILDRTRGSQEDFGIRLFKIKIYEKIGDFKQVEALLKKFVELYPNEKAFQRQLVEFYIDQKRLHDAEKELRVIAAADPTNYEAGLDVVRFLNTFKGAAAARQDLISRISAGGGQAFHYQIALADLYFAEGSVADSIQLLEKLAKGENRDEALTAQIKLAEVNLAGKKFDVAETLASEILRKDSRNVSALRLRASTHLERGRLDAAIADLRQALNDQPRSTDLMLLLAVAYERGGSIELADKQFADATRVSSFSVPTGLNYVAFLRRRGSVARAEDILTELATRSPNSIEVLSALAEVRLTRENWAGAQEVADTIRRIGDNRGIADQILGAALVQRKKYDESITVLEGAYAATPGAMQPMFALVNALIRAQKVDRAVAFLQTVLEKDPANAEAHVLLGSTHLVRNAPDQALKSFETAIARQPKNIIGYRALADLQLRQNKIDDALKTIGAGLREQPDSFAMRLVSASVLELKGEYESAIAVYEQLLQEQSGSMIVANNLASLLSEHRTDKASLERAHALAAGLRKAQVPQFKDTLGWVHYQRGEHKAAAALLEEAVTELPHVALVRYHLGMNYAALGETAKASEHLRKALELAPARGGVEEKIRAALKAQERS